MEVGALVAGFFPRKCVIGGFLLDIFSFSTTAPKWSHANNFL